MTEWDGVTNRDDYHDWIVADRDRLADAARDGRWPDVFEVLRDHSWVNRARVGGGSAFTPLHQAAWHGAEVKVARELVGLGAWRTVRAANGNRAVDVAEEKGHGHLLDVLRPEPKHSLPDDVRRGLEEQLHLLIRGRIPDICARSRLWLPQVGPITELDEPRLWFPVPGLYGGFDIELDGRELIVQSWCRIAGGWAQTHRVGRDSVDLLESGWDI